MSMSFSRRIEALENRRYQLVQKHIDFLEDRTEIYGIPKNLIYYPNNIPIQFHNDDTNLVRAMMGPYGSGKTTTCLQEIVLRACNMPIWFNGRRKLKCLIIRNTSGELHTTTLKSWLMWFGELGDIKKRQKPVLTYEHTFNDGKGVIELELIFLALDNEDDLTKLRSLEITMAYINELSEVPTGVLPHLIGRIGRYPSKQLCPESFWHGIIADTNPPDQDHWIYKKFEEFPISGWKLYKQPPGLLKNSEGEWIDNTDCDNYKNLQERYYLNLANGQTEQFIKVFCLGEYGSVGFGKVVYPEYNDDLHSIDKIDAIQGEPIYLGFDFGFTPACVVCQFTSRGQLLLLKEYTGEDMGIRTFAESIVIPALSRDFPYCKIGNAWADPAGIKGGEVLHELSCIGELNDLGIKTYPGKTNDIATRIASVRYFLNRMVDGKPCFLLSRLTCPLSRKGFIKSYCYKRLRVINEERYQDKPHKNHPFSDLHDGVQYIAMEFAPQSIMKEKGEEKHVNMWNPGFRF